MSTDAKDERYPPAVILQLEALNRRLTRLRIYAVSHGLDDISVWPADYQPLGDAKAVSRGEDVKAMIGLRVADRFVWLDDDMATVLIQALEVSGAAAHVVRSMRQESVRDRSAGN